ncbi:alpha/beta hydrolase [Nocardia sp. NBC_00565]|uniref:alpha/beta fold hydrolase n=1 Tax=Nocardia sp. NBC_00565 TaxID=2975993 RepID=UPI002E82174C|nr:alpha/beta fold hydrolase [Nocardia sp. NBC_00565]WUC06417.1 alpha/beta hydrolase [Nocardia sp. NBC_00565]
MPTMIADGTPIAYTDTGTPPDRPDAATIVFGHGLLFGGWMFRSQIDVLREQYRCIAIDWRGHGETPPTAGGYDMDTLTHDAVEVIRGLRIAPVHWVGLSMGGFVGQRIAARHGELLRSLTLLDTSSEPEDPSKIGEYKRLALVLRLFGAKPILGRVASHLFGPDYLADTANAAVIAEWATHLARSNRAAVRKAVLAVADRAPVDREITAITTPTLVIVGADDKATPPPRSERIAELIPSARLHPIPNCGHSSTLEQPAAITAYLQEFLATVDKV